MDAKVVRFRSGSRLKKKVIETLTSDIASRDDQIAEASEQIRLLTSQVQQRLDPTVFQAEQAEMSQSLENAKDQAARYQQDLSIAQQSVRDLTQNNDALQNQVANLEERLQQKIAEINSIAAELDESSGLTRLVAEQEKEILVLAESLESSTQSANSQIAQLREAVDKKDLRINELESTPPASIYNADTSSGDALQKIEEALLHQSHRMENLEAINQKAFDKIEQLQAEASQRSNRRSKIPAGCDDLSKIQGVGPKFRQKMFDSGIKTIAQISNLTDQQQQEIAEQIGCSQRVIAQWVTRAKTIISA